MATVKKRGNSYLIRVSCGYDINGKQIVRTKTWTPEPSMSARQMQKEIDRQSVLFEEECRTGQIVDGNIKLADYVERWFREYAEVRLKPNTITIYRHLWKRTAAALGHIRMDRINANHLNSFYLNLLDDGIREDSLYKCDDFKSVTKAANMTAVSIAEKAGIRVSTLYELNHGKSIAPETAKRICAVLEQPIDVIFRPARETQKLSHNTVNHYHKFLSTVFRSAVKQGVIADNPCQRADPPQPEDYEPAFLEETDLQRLIEELQKEPIQYRTIIFLLLDSGMRRGELLGLEWKDIDWEKHTVYIRRNSVYLPQKGVFTETPKTKKSIRTIKLPGESLDMLRQYRAWQAQERLKLGDQWQDHDRIFTTWNGKPMHPSTVTGWFSKFAARIGLPDGITVHSLRHTNATLLIAAGTNIRTISARLGHAQTSTTTDIYAHAIQSADAAAAETISSIVHKSRKAQ